MNSTDTMSWLKVLDMAYIYMDLFIDTFKLNNALELNFVHHGSLLLSVNACAPHLAPTCMGSTVSKLRSNPCFSDYPKVLTH